MKKTITILTLGLSLSIFGYANHSLSSATAVNNSKIMENSSKDAFDQETELMVKHSVPCPWILEDMDDRTFEEKVTAYIKELGTITNSKLVGDFKSELLLRAHEDSLEYNRLKDRWGIMEGEQTKAWRALEKELDRYGSFLNALGNLTTRMSFYGKTTLDGTVATCEFDGVRLMTKNSSVIVKCDASDDKFYFYDGDDKTFLEGEDLNLAMSDVRRFFYVFYLLSGQKNPELMKTSYTAQCCWANGLAANDNNKPENITRHDAPKAGALNSISGTALASAKKNDSYKNAVSVIIDTDNWTIDTDAVGNILRRRVGGWVIENTQYGKLARRAQFAQNYSGGTYGATELYGIGGGHMYLK